MKEKPDTLLGKRLSYRQVLWSVPVLLMVHNAEEALTMPHWLELHIPLIREKIFLFRYTDFSAAQLYISLFLVSLIPFILTVVCLRQPLEKRRVFILLVLQGIIFWNALVPHVSGVFFLEMYNPGTVTAMMINIPFSIYLFRRSWREGMFSRKNLRGILLIALIGYLPAVYLNHLLAKAIAGIV